MTKQHSPELLFGGPASVNQNVGSDDETRGFPTEVARLVANLFVFAPSSDRQVGQKLGIGFGIVHDRRIHLGSQRSGERRTDVRAFFGLT
jgi:hypothetical protein